MDASGQQGLGILLELKEEVMEQNIEEYCKRKRKKLLGRKFTFQQNNDLKDKAKATLEWLKNKNVLQWPGQSPDHSPV